MIQLINFSLLVPNDPSGVTVSSVTSASATVTWTAATGTVASYEVSYPGLTNPISVTSGVTTALSGLTAGTSYTVTVKSKSGSSLSPGATGAQVTFTSCK